MSQSRTAIIAKINALIQEQQTLGVDTFSYGDRVFTYCPVEHPNFQEWDRLQSEIMRYTSLLSHTQDRAISQIVYNELLVANANKDRRKSDSMGEYIFLTVNPIEGTSPETLLNVTKQFMSSAVVEFGIFTIEQRSEDGDFHGFHVHMLFKRQRRPSHVTKQINSFFSSYVGNPKHINLQSHDTPEECYNRASYIMGQKKDEKKAMKQSMDTVMRQHYGFSPFYTVGDSTSLVRVPTQVGNRPRLCLKK